MGMTDPSKLPPYLDPPNPVLAEAFWSELAGCSCKVVKEIEAAGLKDTLIFVLGSGSYIGSHLSRNPHWIREFLLTPRGLEPPDYPLIFPELPTDEEKALNMVRLTKVKEHVRIGVRDLLWQAETEETLADLSGLADAVVGAMLQVAYKRCLAIYGKPKDPNSNTVPFAVIGLGKLGGYELNYNSDVDIVYVYYTEKGETTGPRIVNNHQFFVRLSELLTGYLSATTEVGQCYKVDLRLRPEGTKGDITLPLLSYEIYYESYGREWERAMLVKARHIAGDQQLTDGFLNVLKPFVYRRYLDSGVIESMREMKMRIDAEMCKKGSHLDVKLGKGGIREIEFVVNAIQILNGGKRPELRVQGTMKALSIIRELKLLPEEECQALRDAYLFLRNLENRLQMVNCLQTHKLPAEKLEP
jgi:glutamate-ammonia-ligase adenylyltransferase